ncbi:MULTISPECIES: GlsB/YeaQ/YmgE family stress response membrane protein [unclassified Modestobacter]|uniref:GlsB/YeaQ/YmgE family stress response membrane protein n=1 Tax=unclassified Modestobacter TaxID=2643866 RepID=UPI0022AA153B|nr:MULTISPECIES: GlsB/YeaQ/YmgE family stress response membrane protein [unclassified Modestobacter]MCZ2824358.1 GlsB/YeaQ/YmgE family stress response membrane protein [Modestobacter sp. VKM Ac-2981]MCZ2854114.1 GlsB/YeaQ/YmgE family stress response membrane protein [Modestobacter sp. VKM Ac-2982]
MSIGGVLLAILIGFVAGLVARAVVPGKQDLGLVATLLLGLIGSVVGNLVFSLVQGDGLQFDLGGWWASIVGAVLVLAVYVAATGKQRRVTR